MSFEDVRKRWERRAKHILVLSTLAFAVHFVWETIQCPIFFEHGSYDATWSGMVRASVGDIILTWIVFGAVALASGRWRWDALPWGRCSVSVMVLAAVLLAIYVEVRGLRQGRWAYTEITPTVPGIGVSIVPIIQLLVLTPLVVVTARWICPVPGAGSVPGRTEPTDSGETAT